jgi:hypothetical protein
VRSFKFVRLGKLLGARRSKFGSRATYYDGKTLHSTVRDCLPPGPSQCHICSRRSEHSSSVWYQSRDEATCASVLDMKLRAGRIRFWRRSKSVLLVDAPRASDRIRYRPDFDVWITSDPRTDEPDERLEVKGGLAGVAYSGKLKIRLYRDAVRRGDQPPLRVIDNRGHELNL